MYLLWDEQCLAAQNSKVYEIKDEEMQFLQA